MAVSSGQHRRSSCSLASSPFSHLTPEELGEDPLDTSPAAAAADDDGGVGAPADPALDVLEGFGDVDAYLEDDEDLDPLSALEKFCRSELPQQRLTYASGIGSAAELLDPSAVSGSIISLLRELLGDVYADVRLTALHQVLPVARRLRGSGMLFQSDIEALWDLVQPLLLDADVENEEVASVVLAELSHIVAVGNAVVASQKLVWAVQRTQRLPPELQAEGALAALRLISEVVAPREGSPLTFNSIEDFSVGTFKLMATYEHSADVRQAVALLLPRFARHIPASQRAALLPGLVKSLAADTHFNVRCEVPQLLVNLLAADSSGSGSSSAPHAAATAGPVSSSSSSGGSSSGGGGLHQLLGKGAAGAGDSAKGGVRVPPHSRVEETWRPDGLRMLCEVCDKLCRDTSLQVRAAALASLGQLLPLLPAAYVTAPKPPLLSLFASTAKPPPALAGVRVPGSLCAPRLSGRATALRQRHRQQRREAIRAAEARSRSYEHQLEELVKESAAVLESQSGSSGTSSSSSTAVEAAGQGSASLTTKPAGSDNAEGERSSAQDSSWLLGTADNTPVGEEDAGVAAAQAAAAGSGGDGSTDAAAVAAGDSPQLQQAQVQDTAAQPGTAAAELPLACAFHMGKVVLAAGPDCWRHLQHAYLHLATAAVSGAADVAAALLLAFPDMAAALGHEANTAVLVPVVLELLHTQLDSLAPVLSHQLRDITAALPTHLHICLLQLLPNLVLHTDLEFAGAFRSRVAVAEQLPAVAATVSKLHVAYCLWPLLLMLAKDPVAAVRAAAARQAGALLLHLPPHELPPQEHNAAREAEAAAAAAALTRACSVDGREQQQHAAGGDDAAAESGAMEPLLYRTPDTCHDSTTSSSSSSAEAAASARQADDALQQEQALAAEVAARAPDAGDGGTSGSGKLGWMRHGLRSGLQQLQQQLQDGVERVREVPGVQQALSGIDAQGRVLWSLGTKLAGRGGEPDCCELAASAAASGEAAAMSLGELRRHLTSLQLMETAVVDPCRYLPTPAWSALAGELALFARSGSSSSARQVFVVAAGSILAAQQERGGGAASQAGQQQSAQPQQQQGPGLEALLRELQRLADDPVPGVRVGVAAVASSLLSTAGAAGEAGAAGTDSSRDSSARSSPVAASLPSSTGSSTISGGDAVTTGGSSSHAGGSGSGGAVNNGQLAVLQDCLHRLQLDPCVSVADAARRRGAAGGGDDDAGTAVAAADEADCCSLAAAGAPSGARQAAPQSTDSAALL